jgi:hypothetical protein
LIELRQGQRPDWNLAQWGEIVAILSNVPNKQFLEDEAKGYDRNGVVSIAVFSPKLFELLQVLARKPNVEVVVEGESREAPFGNRIAGFFAMGKVVGFDSAFFRR